MVPMVSACMTAVLFRCYGVTRIFLLFLIELRVRGGFRSFFQTFKNVFKKRLEIVMPQGFEIRGVANGENDLAGLREGNNNSVSSFFLGNGREKGKSEEEEGSKFCSHDQSF